MKRLLVDVDGICANFIQHTLDSLVALGGPTVHHDEIGFWNMFRSLPPGWEDQLMGEWHKAGWCRSIPPYAGSLEGISRLRQHGHVVFVTTPMDDAPHWMWERDQWLREHFNASGRDIVFTASKHVVLGDMFVDDKPSHVIEWHEHHPDKIAVLWDCPTNRNESVPPGVLRTNSWDRLASLVGG